MEIKLAAVVFAAAVSREDETKQYSDPLHKWKCNDHFYHWLETQRSLPPLAQLLLHLSSSSSSELEVWNVLAPRSCHQARALSWPDVTDGQARWTVHIGIHTSTASTHLPLSQPPLDRRTAGLAPDLFVAGDPWRDRRLPSLGSLG